MNAAAPDPASNGHVVGFYGDDQELVAEVAEYLIEGVTDGSSLVVASAVHPRDLEERLAVRGTEGAPGTVRSVDAAETFRQCRDDGGPDAERFASVVGGPIDRAGSGRAMQAFQGPAKGRWQVAVNAKTWSRV